MAPGRRKFGASVRSDCNWITVFAFSRLNTSACRSIRESLNFHALLDPHVELVLGIEPRFPSRLGGDVDERLGENGWSVVRRRIAPFARRRIPAPPDWFVSHGRPESTA